MTKPALHSAMQGSLLSQFMRALLKLLAVSTSFLLLALSRSSSYSLTGYLHLSRNHVFLDSFAGASDTVRILSNMSWKIRVIPAQATTWLRWNTSDGSGDTLITIHTLSKNSEVVARSAILVVQPGSGLFAPSPGLAITQKGVN